MNLSAALVAISLMASSTNLMSYPTIERSLIEISFTGSSKTYEEVDGQLQQKVKDVMKELGALDIQYMGPQNFGYTITPVQDHFDYSGYVFFETMPATKGDVVLARLKEKGINAKYGQRCGG